MTAPGLEGLLAEELRQLNLPRGTTTPGGVSFTGTVADVRRVNLWSRIANRVIVRMDEFHASSFHELERRAKRMDWARFVSAGEQVRFRVTCKKSRLYHSDAVAERLAKAAERQLGAKKVEDETGDDVDDGGDAAGQLFIVRIAHDVCTVSADSSGALLHRRGYRQAVAKAPLRETIAAAMLAGSEWDRVSPLVDPMCGSGTIAIEGAMMARQMAPGIGRRFAFENWPNHDADAWEDSIAAARESQLSKAPGPIIASDRDAGAVEAAKANAARAGVEGDIEIGKHAVSAAEIPDQPGWIVTNPPYGLRVGESGPLRNLYSQLGKILRNRAHGYRMALLSADKLLDAQLRVELREVFRTTNGGIPVRLMMAGDG